MRSRATTVMLLAGGLMLTTAAPGSGQQTAALCDRKGPSEWGKAVSVDIVYFQGPCQKELVPGKDATVRVYLSWKSVPGRATVEEYEAVVTLGKGGGGNVSCATPPGPTIIRRPDLYTDSDRRAALNSVNFFGCDLDGVAELEATVQLRTLDIYGQPSGEPTSYPGSQSVKHMASAQTVRATVVFPTVGSWSNGVPGPAIAAATRVLKEGRLFALQNLPIGEVEYDIAASETRIVEPQLQKDPDYDAFEADEEWSVREEPCPGYPGENCRTFVEEDPTLDDELEPSDWLFEELRARWGDDAAHLVIAWVPTDFQGGWSGVSKRAPLDKLTRATKNTLEVGSRSPAVVLLRADANAATVAHELGHYLGLPHHDGTVLGGRVREVEGFRSTSSSGANKSFTEGNGEDPSQLLSLMVDGKPGGDGPTLSFIMNTQYEVLQEDLEDDPLPRVALRSGPYDRGRVRVASIWGAAGAVPAAAELTVLVRGVVAADGSAGRLRAVEWLPHGAAGTAVAASGPASVVFVDGGNRTLATTPIGEHLRTITDNETLSEGAIRFALPLARPPGARAVRLVSSSGEVLAEVPTRGSAPSVRILSPGEGGQWTPSAPIRWETSDPEGDVVGSSVYYSPDGGGAWTPLLVRSRATSITPSGLGPGPDPMLVVAVTDGSGVSADTVRVDVRVPPGVLGAYPAEADTVGPDATIGVRFTAGLSEQTLRRGALELLDSAGSPVEGEAVGRAGGSAVDFLPARPLRHGARYTVRIPAGLEDRSGNRAGPGASWSFRVEADRDPPRIEWITPREAAIAVPVDAQVRIRFSEVVDPSTLEGVRLQASDGGSVPVEVVWNEETRTALLLPERALDGGGAYRVTVPVTVTDIAGNALEVPRAWSFTTR